ncbi:MAG TPA: efflux RND transporter periplasmic adaptor subunit [Cyclobacteriaceae bacterium]|nr:efflux RND transporter periplasmic adaptor subunit [Cyclobacteriaceae bacterium]
MKKYISIIILFACFGLLGCSSRKADTAADVLDGNAVVISDSSLQLMGVRLGKAETKIIHSKIYLNGKVVALPNYEAYVSTDIEGKIEKIFIRDGSRVKRGEPLFTLRSMALIELQSQYIEAKSESDFLAIEYKRQEELIRNNVGALVNFQTIDAQLKAALSKMNALKAKLRLLGIETEKLAEPGNEEISSRVTINAPIDGYVFKLAVQVGQLATTDIVMTELINTDLLMADVYLYDNDLDDVHEGQDVEIDFINHKYKSVTGVVERVAHSFDIETRSVKAHVSFHAPAGEVILPDMAVKCALIKEESKTPKLSIPIAAILEEEDHQFVFLCFNKEKKGSKNIFRKYRVSLGNRSEEEVQIQFANPPTEDFMVVVNNTQIVENERKKMSGLPPN